MYWCIDDPAQITALILLQEQPRLSFVFINIVP